MQFLYTKFVHVYLGDVSGWLSGGVQRFYMDTCRFNPIVYLCDAKHYKDEGSLS